MRIVFVCAHFPPEFQGGVETVARAHARALAARGHQVRVVSGTDRPHAGEDVLVELAGGLEVRRLPRHPEEAYDLLLERPRLRELVVREVGAADVVHVQHTHTLAGGLVQALAARAPVVLSLHDSFAVCPRFFRSAPDPALACPPPGEFDACVRCLAPAAPGVAPARLALDLARRARAQQADVDAAALLLVPSRTHLVRLADHLELGGRARILAPGLCQELPPARRPRAWGGRGPLRVLHAGRRSLEKGTLDLVRALAPLAGRVEIVATGGSSSAAFDALLARAAGELRLVLDPPYDPAALARAASGCHVAAFPSRLPESYSLVIDEALALGLPVWASSGEAARERHGTDAIELLPGGDPRAWTDAFEALLARPERQREALACVPRRLAVAADAAARLERHYETLSAAGRPGASHAS